MLAIELIIAYALLWIVNSITLYLAAGIFRLNTTFNSMMIVSFLITTIGFVTFFLPIFVIAAFIINIFIVKTILECSNIMAVGVILVSSIIRHLIDYGLTIAFQ